MESLLLQFGALGAFCLFLVKMHYKFTESLTDNKEVFTSIDASLKELSSTNKNTIAFLQSTIEYERIQSVSYRDGILRVIEFHEGQSNTRHTELKAILENACISCKVKEVKHGN